MPERGCLANAERNSPRRLHLLAMEEAKDGGWQPALHHLFRAGHALLEGDTGLPTGIAELDAALPWGGYPRGALTELLHALPGIGELSLLLPALRRLPAEQPIALVNPPFLPYAPAWAAAGLSIERLIWVAPARHDAARQALWASEQCLRAGCLAAVLSWSEIDDDRALRRLQLAAQHGGSHAWLFRPRRHAANPSPAALRLLVEAGRVEVLKCRGAMGRAAFARVA